MEQDIGGEPMENRIFGDYEVLKPIGKGKFAVVYRAQKRSNGEIGIIIIIMKYFILYIVN